MSQHDTHLYEYAVIRYVPHIERGEFVNVGLIMMCKRCRWIKSIIHIPVDRIELMKPPHDPATLRHQLRQFESICAGTREAGEIAMLPVEERFRWLTAVRSASIRTSAVHPGITDDLEQTFLRLSQELVY